MGIGIGIGIGVEPVETHLNIIVKPNLLCLGTEVGVDKCKHTIIVYNRVIFTEGFALSNTVHRSYGIKV